VSLTSRRMEQVETRVVGGTVMTRIESGIFHMGSDDHYPEERPLHTRSVEAFWIDRTPVTNVEFSRFVAVTRYVTLAERQPHPDDYPDADPALLLPGSLVFRSPGAAADPDDWQAWWSYLPGAFWRCPQGPGSSIEGLDDHPVVHVAFEDAMAYAAWAGKDLPTESEWEFAARGGLDRAEFAWGDELVPGGRHMANTWQGRFPVENSAEDGYVGTAPVTAFPANGHGLYDMIGNVWEWTKDHYRTSHAEARPATCCTAQNASRAAASAYKVLKGGSHLCAPSYCRRYRPAARQSQSIDTSSGHIGFRCVLRNA
jgi:formylglycine-generating enzyme